MAVMLKTIQRGEPGVPGGDEQKWHATANATGEEVHATSIANARIISAPGPKFEQMLDTPEFAMSGGAT